jgi:hypothetical protein
MRSRRQVATLILGSMILAAVPASAGNCGLDSLPNIDQSVAGWALTLPVRLVSLPCVAGIASSGPTTSQSTAATPAPVAAPQDPTTDLLLLQMQQQQTPPVTNTSLLDLLDDLAAHAIDAAAAL